MNIRLLITYFILISGIFSNVDAQLPQNLIGSNPFSIKWKQIQTDKVQIIFPQELDSVAQRITNIVHYLWDKDENSIGKKNIKIPIILHGLNINSNGFVIVGPFRSEFYNIPSQFKNLTSWVDQLAIHEYRHVQQFANADQGLSGTTKNILGSWVWGGLFATALPRWYFEGDAVIAETVMSSGGRGRFPHFNMQYRALFREGIEYNYEKAGAGSYKDFVPNWYNLGYNMLSFGKEKYGNDLFQKVADDAVRFKGIFFPFGKSLKKHSGLSPKDLYHATLDNLKKEWNNEIDIANEDDSAILNRTDKSTVIHYNTPIPINNGKIIALKTGYNQLNELVLISADGTEKKLTEIGLLPDRQMASLSFSQGKIVWTELGFHNRWRNENYSEIVSYNLESHKKKRLTKKSRYFSPSLSPDGNFIAAVKIKKDLSQSMAILDGNSGNLIKEIYHTKGSEMSYPCWLSENKIAFIETKDQQNQIQIIDVNTLQIVSLTKKSYQHLSHLYYSEGKLYVSLASEYSNNIFRVDLNSGTSYRITSSPIGAFQPAKKGNILYFSELSHQGYNIKHKEINDQEDLINIDAEYSNKAAVVSTNINMNGGNILDKVPSKNFPVTKYKKFSDLINFHSIIPEWQPPEISLSVLSDNTLSTLSASVVGKYNTNENKFRYGAEIRYAELYPIISSSYFQSEREAIFYQFSSPNDSTIVQDVVIEQWNENRASIGFLIPYNFSRGTLNNRFNISMAYQNTAINVDDPGEDRNVSKDTTVVGQNNLNQFESLFTDPISNQTIHTLDFGVSFNMLKFRPRQHLRPKLGISFLARYRANVGSNTLGGNNFLARMILYLPGLSNNHSFSVDAMVANEDILSQYRYSDLFIYPRGYDFSLRRDRFMKVGLNYRFPIAYPDWAIGGLGFVKRLKGNLFFDFGRFGTTSFPFNEQYSSANSIGFELGIELRALRLLEIDFGIRYSYLLNQDFTNGSQHQFDFFVISISE